MSVTMLYFQGKEVTDPDSLEESETAHELKNKCLHYNFPRFGENRKVQRDQTKSV